MNIPGRLVLASRSPRRVHLLNQIGLVHEAIASGVDEVIDEALTPEENARQLAVAKAKDVGRVVPEGIVVGADTIVVLDGEFLGKPEDREDAVRMLRKLSGRTHVVVTGFAILRNPGGRCVSDVERTAVTFREIPEEEIVRYVEGGSPFDKAGAYGIQDDYGAVFVSRVEGCFYNVVGFPLSKFYSALKEFLNGARGFQQR
jgi:septum formation protein